jgi:integrase
LEQARKLAAKRLLEVKNDRDPAEERRAFAAAPTVEDLVARFLDEHASKRSASMQRNSRSLFRLYLLPAVGARKVADVRWEDLERIHRELRDRPYQANRFLAACSKAWALAARWGWWPREIPNPAQGHDRHHEERRGQALDMPGLARLGDALRQEDKDSMPAAAFTFMLLTGCRPGEALKVRWPAIDMDARIWHLPASKAGPRSVYLGRPAIDLLRALPRWRVHLPRSRLRPHVGPQAALGAPGGPRRAAGADAPLRCDAPHVQQHGRLLRRTARDQDAPGRLEETSDDLPESRRQALVRIQADPGAPSGVAFYEV